MNKYYYIILLVMLGIIMPGMLASCSSDDNDSGTDTIITDKSNINSNLALKSENRDVMRLEVPHIRTGKGFRFVSHWAKMTDKSSKTVMNYCFEYDSVWCHSRWVAFTFDDTTKVGSGSRSDAWSADVNLPSACQLAPTSYSGSGYTRGHLCASADRLYSTQANMQTFYMSNMSPQLYNFNSYYWAELELLIRNWSKSSTFKKLYVCKGGTIKEGQRFQGKGYFETTNVRGDAVKVAVPKYYFMAILAETKNNTYQSIGFLLEQHGSYAAAYPSMQQMKQHAMSIDELEKFTDIDFFCNLTDKLEDNVEKGYNPDAWSWN